MSVDGYGRHSELLRARVGFAVVTTRSLLSRIWIAFAPDAESEDKRLIELIRAGPHAPA